MAELTKCAEVAVILPGRFVFAALRNYDGFKRARQAASCMYYCVDNDLVYESFATDFGPLNMGSTYRFCQRTALLLKESQSKGKMLCFFCSPSPEAKANAAVLIGAFQVLLLKRNAQHAYQCLHKMEPFMPFRDAASGPQCFSLTVKDTIEGLGHAQSQNLLNLRTFDIDDYEYCEKVVNGDSTWIVPGKLLAFSGPADVSENFNGFRTKVPEDYWNYFQRKGVTAVVRLNKALYKASRFAAGGFRHYELYFPDGSCPSEEQIERFLQIVESETGGIAIHCKAGLGRTGVLICCYMMKHFKFTARQALGYIRVCRPGSVIGPQQNFIVSQEARMHAAGQALSNDHMAPSTPELSHSKRHHFRQDRSPSNKPSPVFNISVSCQVSDTQVMQALDDGLSGLKLDPEAPVTPPKSRASRLTSFLRFKSSSSKPPRTPCQPSPPDLATISAPALQCKTTPASGTTRITAPNGQPRKIPTALLAAGETGLKAFTADEDQPNSAKSDQWTITTGNHSETDRFSPLGAAFMTKT